MIKQYFLSFAVAHLAPLLNCCVFDGRNKNSNFEKDVFDFDETVGLKI